MKWIKSLWLAAGLMPACLMAGTITGKTFKSSGDSAAIVGAQIILRSGNTSLDTATSGAEGLFTFAEVDSGRYTLAATMAGYQNENGSAFVNGADSTATVNIAMDIIPPPGLVRGTVTDTVNAKVVEGAKVVLSRGNSTTGFRDTAYTDAQGFFGFDSVPANTGYTVAVTFAGYVNRSLNNQTIPSEDTLVLAIGIAPTPTPGLVRGTVTDTVGAKVVAGAQVILSRSGGGGATFRDTTVTDAQGNFGFDSIPANSGYTVAITATGFTNRSLNNQTVPAGDTLKLAIGIAPPLPPGLVRGTVTDTVNNKVLAGARVIFSRFGGGGSFNDTMITDAQGKFAFDSVPANTGYTVAVSLTGFVTRTLNNQTVPGGDTLLLNVNMAPILLGTLTIFAADSADSAALKGASVLARLNSTTSRTGTTGDNGLISFDTVAAGNYSVTVSIAGYIAKSVSVSMGNGENDTGKIYLTKIAEGNSKTLTGIVKDSTGKAVEGATVQLVIGGGGGGGQSSIRLQTTTSATGAYSFAGIPATANNVTLTVTKTGFANSTANVNLEESATTRDVTLTPPVAIFNLVKTRTVKRSSYGTWILPQGSAIHLINGRRTQPR
jgi:hypothetical protein